MGAPPLSPRGGRSKAQAAEGVRRNGREGSLDRRSALARVTGSHQARLICEYDRLDTIAQPHLPEDMRDVRAHCRFAHEEMRRNLGACKSAGNQGQHLELAAPSSRLVRRANGHPVRAGERNPQ